MPKGILESMLRGEGVIEPHVQPMYRLNDNRLMAHEYLARHLDEAGVAHPVGPLLQDPSLCLEDRLILDLRFLESTFQTLARSGDDSHLHFVNLEPVSLEAAGERVGAGDRKSTRLNSSHSRASRMPSSA